VGGWGGLCYCLIGQFPPTNAERGKKKRVLPREGKAPKTKPQHSLIAAEQRASRNGRCSSGRTRGKRKDFGGPVGSDRGRKGWGSCSVEKERNERAEGGAGGGEW